MKNNYYGFFVSFGNLVCLDVNKKYELESLINGPVSWHGKDGRTSVEAGGVQFTFSNPEYGGNGTTVAGGQFPAFRFLSTASVSTNSRYQYPDFVSFCEIGHSISYWLLQPNCTKPCKRNESVINHFCESLKTLK